METHTGVNITKELKEVLKQLGLDDKTVIYIIDHGFNVVKACTVAMQFRTVRLCSAWVA
jgi:hypothetical protein